MDPRYAAGKFFDTLLEVPGWQQMPLTNAAQKVQRSAFPNAYARWEPLAGEILTALGAEIRLVRSEEGRPSVVARFGSGARPRLAWNGHLDTVPTGNASRWSSGPFDGEVVNGRLVGRGACDMKGPIASAIGAIAGIRRAGIGLAAAALLTGSISSLLFEVTPLDLAVFASVAALLSVAGAIASYLPAWRATRMNPLTALRAD